MSLFGVLGAIVLCATCVLAGGMLLALGLRGRRINDHPLCRKCGFDLSGTYPAHSVCSECGRRLNGPKAIRIGSRERIRLLILGGATVLVVGSALGVTAAWTSHSKFDWNTILPTRLLVWRAEYLPDQPVVAELRARRAANQLDAATIKRLVDEGLRVHSRRSVPWLKEWGDFVEEAWLAGSLESDQWDRYVRESIPRLDFDPKSVVRAGDPWALEVSWGARVGSIGQLRNRLTPACLELESESGERFALPTDGCRGGCWLGDWSSQAEGGSGSRLVDQENFKVPSVPPGRYSLRTQLIVEQASDMNEQFRAESAIDLERTITILPVNAPLYKTVNDPSVVDRLRESVRLSNMSDELGCISRFVRASGQAFVDGGIQIYQPPVGVAFDVYVKLPDGREVKCSAALSSAAGKSTACWGFLIALRPSTPVPQSIDIILRPSLEVAQLSKDVDEYWGEDLLIANVPVKPYAPRPKPSRPAQPASSGKP